MAVLDLNGGCSKRFDALPASVAGLLAFLVAGQAPLLPILFERLVIVVVFEPVNLTVIVITQLM